MPTLVELQPLIRRRARLMALRSGLRLDADDMTQEGLIAAARALDNGASAELATVAAWRNMVDRARVETRHRRDEEQQRAWRTESLSTATGAADPAPGPEEQAMWRQMARLVAAAIERLPLQHQLALEVDVTEPGERAAVARQLGVHPSRVSQLRTAALGMLRAQLAA